MIQEQMLDVRRLATGQNYLRYWVASQKNVQLWTQNNATKLYLIGNFYRGVPLN